MISSINLLPQDGEVFYTQNFLETSLADELFIKLNESLKWKEEEVRIFGKWIMQPRLVAWYGDEGTEYTYSGLKHIPNPWTPELLELKKLVEKSVNHQFNSVLANHYRNEKDSNGWHSDDEKELGNNPVIASLSLGETRDFLIKHKKTGERIKLPLEHGSLLMMRGLSQSHWKHTLPKRSREIGSRINLTFRKVFN